MTSPAIFTPISLGPISFSAFEVPERVNGGGGQMLVRQTLVGGDRNINAMGRNDDDLVWSGRFQSDNAAERARYVDQLRASGQKLVLTYDHFAYDVVISDFKWTFERPYQVLYTITCTIIADNTLQLSRAPDPPFEDLVLADYNQASLLGGLINNAGLLSTLSTMGTFLNTANALTGGKTAALRSALGYVTTAQTTTLGLISVSEGNLSAIGGLCGIVPSFGASSVGSSLSALAGSLGGSSLITGGTGISNLSASSIAANLSASSSSMSSLTNLYDMKNVLGRLNANIASVFN